MSVEAQYEVSGRPVCRHEPGRRDHPHIRIPWAQDPRKTFAMLVKGQLVVKVPGRRVDELSDSRARRRFDPGHGPPMKERVSLKPTSSAERLAYMTEALSYVQPPP